MRASIIALAAGLTLTAIAASQASTGPVPADVSAGIASTHPILGASTGNGDDIVIARRGRGADDPAGDDHGRRHGGKGKGKGKGGKGRGGHDDGPNHDRNDDHGVHGPRHT